MTVVSQPKEMQTTDDIGIPPFPSNSAHNYTLCDSHYDNLNNELGNRQIQTKKQDADRSSISFR